MRMERAGLIALQDAETGTVQVIDTDSAAFRAAVAGTAQKRVGDLAADFRSAGIDLVQIDAHRSVVDPLLQFFRMRQKRLRR
jgi:hypothetical protein